MKIKRLISSVLCGTMLASVLCMSAFATTFSDVENDSTVSWAKDSINEMTNLGYIKGYEDGTFKPSRAVSKVETLVLMSRVLGVEDSEYDQSVEWANTAYSSTVNAINTTYVDELSFLMYFNVINITDLRDYASAANSNSSLLRWQAAYLMVKLAGLDSDAKETIMEEGMYSDYESIPENVRPYVAYATNLGLMNGMGSDENGKAIFSPETTLTRAQMATLLNRMMKKMDKSYDIGKISSVNASDKQIDIDVEDDTKTCELDGNTAIKINGEDSKISNITEQSDVMVTYTFGNVRMIETIPAQEKKTIYGVVVQTSDNSNGQQVAIKDYEDESNKVTYTFASNCTFTVKGTQGAFGDIKSGSFVRLVLTGSKVTECYIENKSSSIDGFFVSATSDDDNHTYVTINDGSSDEDVKYDVSSTGLNVTRNGFTANLRDIAKGDSVTLELTYGKVTALQAKSKTSDATGTIKEIILSDSPSITLVIENKSYTYSLTSNTKVTVNGVEGTIYDLRPSNAATVKIDGTNIASIDSSATSSTGKTTVSGKVSSINTTLKVITVTNANGSTETIYYDTSTTFLKSSTGKSMSAKDVVAGTTITATGADTTGYFVAKIVIAD